MSFFEELKRRNVFRVGIAYAVTAWVLIQALDIFLPTFEAPTWVMKVISAVLIAGFPLVLIFAWAYELTPEGVRREKDVDKSLSISSRTGKKLNHAIMVLMAVAIGFLLFERFAGRDAESTAVEPALVDASTVAPFAPAEPAIDRKSIAVLPFDNRSRLEDDAFFVEGIHDDLLTNLARIGSLKVISRTSVSKYKDTEKTIPEIANELGVATVMEGAVQRAGNTVRINVQLIDARTDEHLWAEIFDRELTAENLFAIQSEISSQIASALKAALSPEEQQRISEKPTENLAAYNAYMRGRLLLATRSSEGVDQAAGEFQSAVDLDPGFALAWVGVADAAALRTLYSDLDPVDSLQQRRAATERALALNDRLGEAHLAKATLLEEDELFPEAEAAFLRAIKLGPGYAQAYHWYSDFLRRFPHRRKEALAVVRKAEELDPRSSIIQLAVGGSYASLGRYEEAAAQVQSLLQLDPGFAPAMNRMADLASATGRVDEAIRWLRKSIETDPGRLGQYIDLLWAYFDLGDTEAIAGIRKQMEAINPQHVFLGFADMAQSMYVGNYPAALEGANWVFTRMGRQPWILGIMGLLNNMSRDYEKSREHFEASDPRLFRPEHWRAAIEDEPWRACMVGFVLLQTYDMEMGNRLLDETLDYLENELPGYVDHADRFGAEWCYMARGETEKALATLGTLVDHRHYAGWWFMRKHPQWEPLWGEPRFETLMARIEEDISVQRENLSRMEAGDAGP